MNHGIHYFACNEELKMAAVCSVESYITGRRFVSLPFSDHCEPLWRLKGESDDLIRTFGKPWKIRI